MTHAPNRSKWPIAILLAALLPLAACGDNFFREEHICKVKGYSYRYRDGVRIEESIPETVEFSLATFKYRKHFRINANGLFPEHNAPGILLDKAMSNPAEAIYISDKTGQDKFRIVTSLVLNLVSGDVRVFHHRWIPPKEWRDSDMYMFTGNCRKK